MYTSDIAPARSNRQQRERPQTTHVARGKNWIVLNVVPIARAFKANVLHPLKSLMPTFD
jgi:hypothetical protein